MELSQVQAQQLNHQQLQGLKVLQMGTMELEQYLRELTQENPLVDLEPEAPAPEKEDELLQYLQWLEDNDHQNLYCQQLSEEELDPRPGAVFDRAEQTPYILPDLFVEERDGRYTAHLRKPGRPPFQINGYYRGLLAQSKDPQVANYLREKLQQAESVLQAVSQRESTLLRCAQAIVDAQTEFFRQGPQALRPMTMAETAERLGLHESTVSRAARDKYIQCPQGTYPLSYFFSRSATAKKGAAQVGGTAARLMLKGLIDQEDPRSPLSDQKLAGLMTQAGCPISRRTVAKYRGEMNIPDMPGRKHSGS